MHVHTHTHTHTHALQTLYNHMITTQYMYKRVLMYIQ